MFCFSISGLLFYLFFNFQRGTFTSVLLVHAIYLQARFCLGEILLQLLSITHVRRAIVLRHF